MDPVVYFCGSVCGNPVAVNKRRRGGRGEGDMGVVVCDSVD